MSLQLLLFGFRHHLIALTRQEAAPAVYNQLIALDGHSVQAVQHITLAIEGVLGIPVDTQTFQASAEAEGDWQRYIRPTAAPRHLHLHLRPVYLLDHWTKGHELLLMTEGQAHENFAFLSLGLPLVLLPAFEIDGVCPASLNIRAAQQLTETHLAAGKLDAAMTDALTRYVQDHLQQGTLTPSVALGLTVFGADQTPTSVFVVNDRRLRILTRLSGDVEDTGAVLHDFGYTVLDLGNMTDAVAEARAFAQARQLSPSEDDLTLSLFDTPAELVEAQEVLLSSRAAINAAASTETS